jgi:hypothetical protein
MLMEQVLTFLQAAAQRGDFEEAKKQFIRSLQLADSLEKVDNGLYGKIHSQYGIVLGFIGDLDQV